MEPAPTGYPAVSEAWVNSGSMLNRMNFAVALAGGRLDGIRIDIARFGARQGEAWLESAVAGMLPATPRGALLSGIRADLEEQAQAGAGPRALAARAIGLTLGSPEFQRH
jgi:hypothetical protein